MSITVTPLAEVIRRPRTVAVGQFDGVHLGHRRVIDGADTVLTFEPHPTSVLRPDQAPALLMDAMRKADVLGTLGVREVVLIPFDRAFASLSPGEFVEEVLVKTLDARRVRIGENFHYGHRAEGRPAQLQQDERFDTTVVPMLLSGESPISSTRIRDLVATGEIGEANRLLGTAFTVTGVVCHGEQRGRELGYPTANLEPQDGFATPAFGVYAGRAKLQDGSVHRAAISIGVRPQFETKLGVLIEAFLLDFDGDLYGQKIELEIIERLRGEQKFSGVEALVEQIERDVEQTRDLVELPS